MRVLGARDHELTLLSAHDVCTGFRRLRFSSPTLLAEVAPEPAAWVRIWFPDPAHPGREVQRGYTIAEADPETGELDIDVVIHEPAGPASAWATTAVPGATVMAQSYGSEPFVADPAARGLLLVGDPSAVPAVNGILRAVPDVPVELFLEQHHDHERDIPLAPHPSLHVTRVPHSPGALAGSIGSRDWANWQVWAAGESAALRALRALRGRPGGTKANTYLQAYWIRGRAMGRTRDDTSGPVPD
ncbi:siderophore-interacting protein [Propionicicella superfundia]|uniref:siderophore-interacting protein n=1 Tax=Propionicicella superfundia TaxID=348582 RepID=UPI000684BB87|nr:siderophore-interacting protein [Propionicicella superfundia]